MTNQEKSTSIEGLVDDFLARQANTFSRIWRDDLIERVAALSGRLAHAVEQSGRALEFVIHEEHYKKLFEIRKASGNRFKNRFPKYSQDYVDDLVSEAFSQWLAKFDADKSQHSSNPELHFLNLLVANEHSDYMRKHYPVVGEERDTDGDIRKIRRADVPVEEACNLKSPTPDEGGADEPPVEIFKFGGKTFAFAVVKEILRFYSLIGRVEYTPGRRPLQYEVVRERGQQSYLEIREPKLRPVYEHDEQALVEEHRDYFPDTGYFELLHVNNLAKYSKQRWEILRSADTRRWMELAVAEMRKSEEKKRRQLSSMDGATEEYKKLAGTPVLGSVVIDASGTRVFTCFKGQVDEARVENGAVRDITWDKHCEYSLFTEVVGEENMHLLEGGTLYVTLEPCNERKATGAGEIRRAKIPCAVRCVEAGLKRVYVGSFDYNETVFGEGVRIIRSGEYEFELKDGQHTDEDAKIAEGSILLERYFVYRNYPLIASDERRRVYRIGKPVEVSFFDVDLFNEAYNLNAMFQRMHNKSAFNSR